MTPKTPRTARPTHLRSDTGSLSIKSAPVSPSPGLKSALDANAPAFIPGRMMLGISRTQSETSDGASTPSSITAGSDSTTGSLRWSPVDDPNDEFVRLKVRIMELTTHRRPDETADATFLQDLQRRLKDVQENYLFDRREAEALFQVERNKVEAAALEARLRGLNVSTPVKPPRTPGKAKEPPSRADSSVSVSDVFDDDSDAPGGLFELLDEMPESIVTDTGVTVRVRDMALPKHWSGRTPKLLLTENVRKTDKYAVISFNLISGPTRVKRTSVDIRWDGGKTQAWSMDDVACYDQAQAEQYISTVALHALTFPNPDGFAIGGTAAASSQTSFRLLPPVFRDLWDELEKKRRTADDSINRVVWGKLRSILEPKLSPSSRVGSYDVHMRCRGG